MGLAGWRFALAVGAIFVLGALVGVGIGNYAPSMALLAILGMHPIAAYPIMIASDGVLIPVGVYFTFEPHWEVRKSYYGEGELV
jgi:hypothetical protein